VVLAAGDEEQRSAVVVLEVDGDCGVRVDVGQRALEENAAGSWDGVAVVDRTGLGFAQGVGEGIG
jgi:hypothetical protein